MWSTAARETWRRLRAWFARLWIRGTVESEVWHDPAYKAAVEFKKSFTPQPEKLTSPSQANVPVLNYEWVNQYAKDNYDRLNAAFESLDEKADSIIKYLGGGTAIVSLAAVANVTAANAFLVLLLLPSICLALRAIYFATLARMPVVLTLPPDLATAIEYVKAFGNEAQDTFLGTWHQASIGLRLTVQQKAARVTEAKRYFWRALMLLLLPVLVWSTWKLCQSWFSKD